jgi:uncharacterized protein YycO
VGSGVVFVLGALLWTHLGVGSQAAYWLGLAPPSTVYHDARADVRPGDLVFRRGRSLVSYAVLYADPTSRYSHVGLVVQTQGDTLVVHATPGPHGEPPAPVRVEPLSVFLAPDHAVQAAVVRAPASHARRAAQVARTYATDARVFDDAFDLATADQLYCTELVWRAYRTAGLDLIDGALDTVALPWASGDRFVLPSTLYRSPHLRVVFPTPVATAPPTRAASALPR